MYHKPVLLNESVDALAIESRSNGVFADVTLGGGGHTREILKRLGPEGRLIVFDKDPDALANAPADERVIKVHGNFRFIENYVRYLGTGNLDGILADLGVSSHQFDTAERGFSFRFDAPLDMRMNTLSETTAADIVNDSGKEELTEILREYGEVENAAKVAEAICGARDTGKGLRTTGELCGALSKFYNQQTERKFLAKVFQALRIEVNGEMRALEDLMTGCRNTLTAGGRLSVITYHSLEDRMVKNFIRDCKAEGTMMPVNKKPVLPADEEISGNGRARSAKLRVAARI